MTGFELSHNHCQPGTNARKLVALTDCTLSLNNDRAKFKTVDHIVTKTD